MLSTQTLDISRNQLNGFDSELLSRLYGIPDVRLAENPWICDRCHIGLLVDHSASVITKYTTFA